MTSARNALLLLATLVAGAAFAQAQPPAPPPPPPGAAQVAPPPLPPDANDPDLEPQVTIIRRDDNVVEEVRIKGELRFVKVTPRHGRPYYLIPDAGGNTYIRRDNLDTSLKVPMWVLFSF
jgi:hypothetical protein